MALGAAAVLLGGIVLVAFGGGKKRRTKKNGNKQLPPEPPTPPDEEPAIRWEAEEWFMPEGWLEVYATPRLGEYVVPRHDAGDEIDPLDVTLYLIQGQTSAFPLPAAPRPPVPQPPASAGDGMWQVDVPDRADYYEGPESVLGLMYHVNEYVEDALGRWQAGDNLYLAELGWPDEEGGN